MPQHGISDQHTPSGIPLCSSRRGPRWRTGTILHRVLVIPKTEDKELDIYVSTQDPAHVQVRSKLAPTSPTCSFRRGLQSPQPHRWQPVYLQNLESKDGTSVEQLRPETPFIFSGLVKQIKSSHSRFRFTEDIHLHRTHLNDLRDWMTTRNSICT